MAAKAASALVLLLSLGSFASAALVRVPAMPPKFSGGDIGAAWRVWQEPLVGSFLAARSQQLTLSPELQAFVPVMGVAKKDGAPAAVAPRGAALHLLTVQLQAAGVTPEAFEALPVAGRVTAMQTAYDALRGELHTYGEALAAAAEEAEKVGDRAALQEIQSRLSLLVMAHGDYIEVQAKNSLRAARDKAFAAHAKLAEAVVGGALKSGQDAMGAAVSGKTGFAALGNDPDPWRGATPDPHAAARKAVLAPLDGGKVPAGFVEEFARYQQMGDPGLSFAALKAFKPIVSNPFASGEDAARALQGIGLIARDAPAERARDLAVQALIANRFLAPDMETLRVFTLRDVGAATTDKDLMGSIIKSLTADAGAKREGPAGEALAAVEAAWKTNFGVPTPVKAAELRAKGEKAVSKGMLNTLMGLVGAGLFYFGVFSMPTSMPSFLSFLSFLLPVMPYLPYVGVVMGVGTLVWGIVLKMRAGPKR